ncbi:hypothetical protein HDV00_001565 [Rhizophlyctis rosea]|nr:hypothetical protein HDV00_001565 [Rhizophlyctis rosea]
MLPTASFRSPFSSGFDLSLTTSDRPPPPQLSDDQVLKGGHALRKLKNYSDSLYQANLDLRAQIQAAQGVLDTMHLEKLNLQAEIQDKSDRIATLKQKEFREVKVSRSQEECEKILEDEKRKRIRAQAEVKELVVTLEKTRAGHEVYRREVTEREAQRTAQDHVVAEQKKKIEELEGVIKYIFELCLVEPPVKNLEFDIDEQRVLTVKFQKKSDDLEKALNTLTQKHDYLTQSEQMYRDENGQLQKRLRELIEANKEVTANYQAVKKNQDLKRSEFEELAMELEEAKTACQLAIRQKKHLQTELNFLIKQRAELTDKSKQLEALLARKEKDISDLLTKVNDTINDYEQRLERKEEQMWALSVQVAENAAAPQMGGGVGGGRGGGGDKKGGKMDIDTDFIDGIEKKWQAKEKVLQTEMERLTLLIRTKEEEIGGLKVVIDDLKKRQFQPRMERIKAIERDIKNRMEEYALAEERMEHTYCTPCLDYIKEENYNVVRCKECSTNVEHVFRNEQLERVEEQFVRRRELTLEFLEWIKMLKTYLPSDDEDVKK